MPGLPISDFSANLFTVPGTLLWLALAATALFLDFVAGQYINRYMPSLDTLFKHFTQFTVKKLDRPSRTLSALRLRGFIVVGLGLPMTFFAGLLLNYLMVQSPYALLGAAGLLIPLLGQKEGLQRIIITGRQLENTQDNDPHHIVRTAGAKAVLDFATKLVPRTLWWCLGGFAFLLPQILLDTSIDEAEKRQSGYPESPFFSVASILHEITTAPPAIAAAALIALAHFFIPGTNLAVFKAFTSYKASFYGPASRYFPINVIATGLDLSLEATASEKSGSKKLSDKAIRWIGPKDGRAQLLPADLKQIWLVTLVAFALYVLIATMIFALLLLNGTAQ